MTLILVYYYYYGTVLLYCIVLCTLVNYVPEALLVSTYRIIVILYINFPISPLQLDYN